MDNQNTQQPASVIQSSPPQPVAPSTQNPAKPAFSFKKKFIFLLLALFIALILFVYMLSRSGFVDPVLRETDRHTIVKTKKPESLRFDENNVYQSIKKRLEEKFR